MPFRSQAQAKWTFATKQPWARKWGHKTRLDGGIDRLPQYVTRKGRKWGKRRLIAQKDVPSATPGIGNVSGPGGLFSSAALDRSVSAAVNRRPHLVNRARRARPQITTKSEGHTGAIVALYLPLDAAKVIGRAAVDLFAERAENEGDLHITLAYLGKISDIEDRLPVLVPAIQRYVQMWLETVGIPIPIQVGGYKAFDQLQDDGSVPIYREVHSPLLMSWVEGLDSVLSFGGVPADRQYGPYTPHITVSYSYPELKQLLPITPASSLIVQFSSVVLCLGDIHISMPLSLPTFKAVASDEGRPQTGRTKPVAPTGAPAAAAPAVGGGGGSLPAGVTRIRGNLCNVHGKFGPCDSATSEGFGKKPKKAKGGGKPKPTDAERQAKRAQDKQAAAAAAQAQKVQNRTDSLAKLSNRPNDAAMAVLDQLRQGGTGDPALLQSMEHTGLVQKHSDGSYTLSSHGHGLLNALDKGDAGAAAEAIAGGGDKIAGDVDRASQRDQAKKDREARIAQRDADRKARQAQTAARREARDKKHKSDNEGDTDDNGHKKKKRPVKAPRAYLQRPNRPLSGETGASVPSTTPTDAQSIHTAPVTPTPIAKVPGAPKPRQRRGPIGPKNTGPIKPQ